MVRNLNSCLSCQKRETLKYDDSQFNFVAPATVAYLAALHFATSEYQQAMRFCLAVFVDNTSQEEAESLNAGCLLFIGDIARIVGLCVLQKMITEGNLPYIRRQLYLDLRLSPEVFAIYLAVLSVERKFKQSEFPNDLPESSFPMDEYLKASLKSKSVASMKSSVQCNAARRIVYCKSFIALAETEASRVNPKALKERVLDALMEYALENMTSFYSVIRVDFRVNCNTVDCYRALYLYKCRQYDELLQLCERKLREPDLQNSLHEFSFANVLLLAPFDYFFDTDVQSLLGFHTLFYYLSL